MCDVAGTAGYQVDRLDEGTNPTRTIHVEDSNDISIVSTDLPSQDLFRTKIQVNCDTVKLVIITIFYSTGTILVQGNRCSVPSSNALGPSSLCRPGEGAGVA